MSKQRYVLSHLREHWGGGGMAWVGRIGGEIR